MFTRLTALPVVGAVLVATLNSATPAHAKPGNLSGKYTNGFDRYPNVTLVLQQSGNKAHGVVTIIGDSSNMNVVTTEFNGRVASGVVSFDWTDNYGNAGHASFRAAGRGYLLSSRMTELTNDGRYFDGKFLLTRVSTRVGANDLPKRQAP